MDKGKEEGNVCDGVRDEWRYGTYLADKDRTTVRWHRTKNSCWYDCNQDPDCTGCGIYKNVWYTWAESMSDCDELKTTDRRRRLQNTMFIITMAAAAEDCENGMVDKHASGGDCDDIVYTCCTHPRCGALSDGAVVAIILGSIFGAMGIFLCATDHRFRERCIEWWAELFYGLGMAICSIPYYICLGICSGLCCIYEGCMYQLCCKRARQELKEDDDLALKIYEAALHSALARPFGAAVEELPPGVLDTVVGYVETPEVRTMIGRSMLEHRVGLGAGCCSAFCGDGAAYSSCLAAPSEEEQKAVIYAPKPKPKPKFVREAKASGCQCSACTRRRTRQKRQEPSRQFVLHGRHRNGTGVYFVEMV